MQFLRDERVMNCNQFRGRHWESNHWPQIGLVSQDALDAEFSDRYVSVLMIKLEFSPILVLPFIVNECSCSCVMELAIVQNDKS